ncbi:MAG: hypothetical protein Q7S89_00650 [bacterium]|nr:hypothetical protein [bacterium]
MHDGNLDEVVRQWDHLRVAEKVFGDMVERGDEIRAIRMHRGKREEIISARGPRQFRHGDWVSVRGLWYTVQVSRGSGRGRFVTIGDVSRA